MKGEKEIFVCPMCKGRKQIDNTEHNLYSPSDKTMFGKCILCDGEGYIIHTEK